MASREKPVSPFARAWSLVAARYFTVDLRTLGAFRIAFGVFLLGDLYVRAYGANGLTFFTDSGVLPGFEVLKQHDGTAWSLLFAITSVGQLHVALVIMTFVYVAYTVGWHTR